MRKLFVLTAIVALVTVFGFSGPAAADPWADVVEQYSPSGGDFTGSAALASVLGVPDNVGPSLGNDGTGFIRVRFTDNACLDLDGDDIRVDEVDNNENYFVNVGNLGDSPPLTPSGAGSVTGDEDIDLNGALSDGAWTRTQITDDATAPNAGTTTQGADIDAVTCLHSLDQADIVKDTLFHPDDTGGGHTGDKDTVFFGLNTQQFKAFTITITNSTGVDGGLAGLIFIDATGAEWDLDPTQGSTADGGAMDGVDVTAADGALTDCTAVGAEHTNQGKSGKEQLKPDKITITADGLDNGESCTITAWVMTDRKKNGTRPGRGNSPSWAPTDCPVPLNDGVKVFDASFNLLLMDDDELEFSNPVDGTCEIPT